MIRGDARKPLVCLLRDAASDDPYRQALETMGFETMSMQVLRFEFVQTMNLRDTLAQPQHFGGLILTSPRAAEALCRFLPPESAWASKPAFVVGPKTAAVAALCGLAAVGEEAGSADKLAELIVKQQFDKPLLFLCGNRRRDALPQRLAEAGIPMKELCVYQTMLVESFDFSAHRMPEWFVVFSPSGAEAMKQTGGFDPGQVRWAALGETTAAAVRRAGWTVSAVAEQPEPEALAKAIRQASG